MAKHKKNKDKGKKPIRVPTQLRKRVAEPTLAGVRSMWSESVSSSLSPQRLGAILREVDSGGEIENYLTLAEEMEERDLHYRGVLGQRKLAVSSLDITVTPYDDSKEAERHADLVRDVLSDEAAISPLLTNLLDALGKGFSVCEIIWDRGSIWTPLEYIYRPQKFFRFDRLTGTEVRLRDNLDLVNGLELKPYKFIAHIPLIKSGAPIRGGLARLSAVAYMCKGYSIKDWLAFAEVYGMPIRLGKYDSQASDDQKAELLNAIVNLGTDAAAIIPKNMDVDFLDGARQMQGVGEGVFERLANWLDKQVSKGILGQTSTTDVGGSYAQSKTHDGVRHDIVQSDARQLSATLCRDLAQPLVNLNFGKQPRGRYPKIVVASEDGEDLVALAQSLPEFIKLGLPVAVSDILEKFGLDAPEDGAAILGLSGKEGGTTDTIVKPEDSTQDTIPGTIQPSDTLAKDDEKHMKMQLVEKIMRGETLTDEQRNLLSMLQENEKYVDEIDRIVDEELATWQKVMQPALGPVIALAEKSNSFEEFAEGLKKIQGKMGLEPLTESIAKSTLKARVLGDTRDKL